MKNGLELVATKYEGTIISCNEEELEWVPFDKIMDLKLWEGDKIFLKILMENHPEFEMEVLYEGEKLVKSSFSFGSNGNGSR